MANNLPIIRKAFLATRNAPSGMFLLTERFENEPSDTLLFYIIESQNKKHAEILQKSIQSDLVKPYMSSSSFSIGNFEEALHYINQGKGQTAIDSNSNPVNALVGLLENNTLHISMIGTIEGFLLRRGKINSITEGLIQPNDNSFANITSGELLLNDSVIIANKNLFDRLSLDRIRRTLNQFSPHEAIRDFYQILRKTKNFDCNALLFQVSPPLSLDKENRNLPDLLYVDEAVDSNISKFIKKSKPLAASSYQAIKSGSRKSAAILKAAGLKTRGFWQKNISPHSKKLVSSVVHKTSNSLSRISPKIISGSDSRQSNLKIRPYLKKRTLNIKPVLNQLSSFARWISAKNHRRYLYIIIIVILVLVSYLKINSNNKNRDQVKIQNDASFAFEQAGQTFKTATSDLALGKTNAVDELKDALIQAQSATQSDSFKAEALGLVRQIQDTIDSLSKTKRYYNLAPIFSFKNEPLVSAISGSKIYAFNSDGKIYATDARDKDPKLIAAIDESLGKPISASYSDSMGLVIALTDKSRVWAYDEQTQTGAEMTLDPAGDWETSTAVSAYSTNLYLLDSINGKIWRHSKSDTRFSSGKTFANSKNTDAKNGISMAIDGSIYILKDDGKVTKFAHSAVDTSFSLQAIPSPSIPLTKANTIYTDADSQYIFILEKENNRVVKYGKDGLYAGQYIIDGTKVSQVLVNSRVQKIWLVSDKDVYELDL